MRARTKIGHPHRYGPLVEAGDRPSIDDLLAAGIKAATAYERADLASRLRVALDGLGRSHATVLFVGEFKAGKSSLVNAVIGADACPVDDDVATAVLTVLRHHAEPAAAVVSMRAGAQHVERVAIEQATAAIVAAPLDGDERVVRVDIGLPSPLLARGLVVADTPGAGGLGGPQGAVTMSATARADAVVFVTASRQELTDTELAYLRQVRALCDDVVIVETKTDLHPSWRRVVQLDAAHAARAGVDAPVLGVSAVLAGVAGDESGVPVLVDWLARDVATAHRERRAMRAVDTLSDTVAQLRARFETERIALTGDRTESEELVRALAGAEEAATTARSIASKWGQALTDGFSDVVTVLERDLRERSRALLADAEAAIDGFDPARGWDAFERDLYERTAAAATAHAQLRHERLLDAIGRVATVFGAEDAGAEGLGTGAAADRASTALVGAATFTTSSPNVLTNALVLLRSSYGGLAMLGFLGGLTGVVVAAPLLAAVGVALGGKGFKDERARQVAQRRSQAKVSVRRYLDEITYALGNETRDTVRHVQREVRDHFSARAHERQAGAAAALAAARQAIELDTASRRRRLADVDAELGRINALAARVDAARPVMVAT